MKTYLKDPMQDDDSKKNVPILPIPMLVKLEQVSPFQIEISYDIDIDVRLGTKSTNYWIKDTMNVIPKGIATPGRNSLTDSFEIGRAHV